MSKFQVCAQRCDQCLFSERRIVSKQRMNNILRACRANDSHFVCHKHTIRNREAQVCCRGFYDANPFATNLMRIAARLGMVEFVDEQGNAVSVPTESEAR